MKKNTERGTAKYIVEHGLSRIKRGKNPSSIFSTFKNPKIAFEKAQEVLNGLFFYFKSNALVGNAFI